MIIAQFDAEVVTRDGGTRMHSQLIVAETVTMVDALAVGLMQKLANDEVCPEMAKWATLSSPTFIGLCEGGPDDDHSQCFGHTMHFGEVQQRFEVADDPWGEIDRLNGDA